LIKKSLADDSEHAWPVLVQANTSPHIRKVMRMRAPIQGMSLATRSFIHDENFL